MSLHDSDHLLRDAHRRLWKHLAWADAEILAALQGGRQAPADYIAFVRGAPAATEATSHPDPASELGDTGAP
jgi:hypothetical protein